MKKIGTRAREQSQNTYRRLLLALLVVSALATAFFAVRGVVQFVYWSNPDHRDQVLEPWMPLGFVARSYGVEREILAAELGVSPESNRRLTLKSLAELRGQSFEDVASDVGAAIRDIRSR